MENILKDYRALLSSVDDWFARSQKAAGEQMRCAKGCAACCRGLFDITMLDAYLLKSAFDRLAAPVKEAALVKARQRLTQLQRQWPGFCAPYILNGMPDEEWIEMPEEDETPCPLLSEEGECLVYEDRPLLCRTHGLPNIDLSGESFSDDWCTLNFAGVDPLAMKELRWEFRKTFEEELRLFGRFTFCLLGRPLSELDTFIPTALLIDFENTDWGEVALPE